MRTTTYRAPDKTRGYRGGEIAAILSKHDPEATLVVRVGWKGQPQQLTVTEPDAPLVEPRRTAEQHRAEWCETPAPELPESARGTVQDTLTLNAIAEATRAEELVREELANEGIDVDAVERAARRAQARGLGGAL